MTLNFYPIVLRTAGATASIKHVWAESDKQALHHALVVAVTILPATLENLHYSVWDQIITVDTQ